jgi:rhodanese-related sulfurtransferase
MTTQTISPASTMREVLAAFPGARRALFRRYHIGGCASCGFQPEETLGALCRRSGGLEVNEIIAHIETSHQQDLQMLVEPRALADELNSSTPPRLLDIRPREEWEAARIQGSELLTQDGVQQLMASPDRHQAIVIVDHLGAESLDAAAYFAGHGFARIRALRGGLDAWSTEVDPDVPRYRLES